MLLQILIPLIIFVILDIHLRLLKNLKDKWRVIRVFESLFLIFYIIYVTYISNKTNYLVMMSTFILSISFIFREILANAGATVVLFLFPLYKQGDVISINNYTGTYNSLGLLRTSIVETNGTNIRIPNSNLVSGLLTVHD